ncbi:MAG: VanZ family protein [Ignavibacteria bacterium]|nr:VanZ family protein [Ignavibacteria bacterium]MBT8382104.1 VanZ family protein [Ignavibacteria bacterium]MBT8392016.1 VanZ family protein [Ignavibacteria bacterium]NNJ51817.1 VanZ family protein [Ignavibacteriaceae bacterium]NNL21886.1 VanZ family protein [Ignavibacteriaceae bacterium]
MFKFLEGKKKLLVYTPLIIYWIILFIATTLPVQSVPTFAVSDKLHHLAAYFVLSVLLHLTLLFQRKSEYLFNNAPSMAIIIASVYGALDEMHQMFVPGRFAEVLDWLADLGGAVLGVVFVSFLIKKLKYVPNFN